MIRHDFHIHTRLSSCSHDPLQTPRNIYRKAVESGLTQICLTDHFWDSNIPGASDWYASQDLDHIRTSLSEYPAQNGETRIFFGCETEFVGGTSVGISREIAAEMDFILIPISHFHMKGYVRPAHIDTAGGIAELWMSRYRELLEVDLPWSSVGLAHVTDCCVGELQPGFLKHVLGKPHRDLREMFVQTAEMGISIEINGASLFEGEVAQMNREIFTLMKECGCRFTAGSDAHSQERMGVIQNAFEFAESIGLVDADFNRL